MNWDPADKPIRLDGFFTAEELIWIAEHMKSNSRAEK